MIHLPRGWLAQSTTQPGKTLKRALDRIFHLIMQARRAGFATKEKMKQVKRWERWWTELQTALKYSCRALRANLGGAPNRV